MSMSRVIVVGILSVSLIALGAGVASGQPYPYKPIRIMANEAGGGNDFVARMVAQALSASVGQPVIVENRPNIISTVTVAKAEPDGYTLLSQGQSVWIGPLMRDHVPYDPVKSFAPITIMMGAPLILVVTPAFPVQSVKELIALAKAKPGALNYSAATRGSAVHLAPELFKSMAGVDIVYVAYNSTAPALAALLAGQVQLSFPTAPSAGPLLKAGKLKALAVTSAQPSVLVPGVPTMAASGLPGYELLNYTGMFAPAKTPVTIIRRLNQEVVRALNQSDIKEKLANTGAEVVGSSPEQAASVIKSDMARLGKVIKDAGIRAD